MSRSVRPPRGMLQSGSACCLLVPPQTCLRELPEFPTRQYSDQQLEKDDREDDREEFRAGRNQVNTLVILTLLSANMKDPPRAFTLSFSPFIPQLLSHSAHALLFIHISAGCRISKGTSALFFVYTEGMMNGAVASARWFICLFSYSTLSGERRTYGVAADRSFSRLEHLVIRLHLLWLMRRAAQSLNTLLSLTRRSPVPSAALKHFLHNTSFNYVVLFMNDFSNVFSTSPAPLHHLSQKHHMQPILCPTVMVNTLPNVLSRVYFNI